MTTQKTNVKIGGSISNLLTSTFIVLKIVDVKPIGDWNWLWVLSPTLIPLGIAFVIAMIWAAIAMRR